MSKHPTPSRLCAPVVRHGWTLGYSTRRGAPFSECAHLSWSNNVSAHARADPHRVNDADTPPSRYVSTGDEEEASEEGEEEEEQDDEDDEDEEEGAEPKEANGVKGRSNHPLPPIPPSHLPPLQHMTVGKGASSWPPASTDF